MATNKDESGHDSALDLIHGKFAYLLASLVILLVAAAMMGNGHLASTAFCLLITGVLLVAAVTVCRHHKNLVPGLLLAIPTVILNWVGYAMASRGVFIAHNLLLIVFFTFVAYHVLYAVLADRRVTLDTIRGAVCVYLLAGLAWAYVYGIILLTDANTFQFPSKSEATSMSAFGESNFSQTAYYSFVTMTTLGYGDIRPLTPPARTTSILQAVFGQFYLAVLVARLVALHIQTVSLRNRDPGEQ